MFFANTSKSSSPNGDAPSLPNSAECTGTSATAALLHAERGWSSAISAQTGTLCFNSCGNRHCPRCQSSARDRWLVKMARDLLPVPYCHVVFTLPSQLIPLAYQNTRVIYNLLFRAASEALLSIGADPKRMGAKVGFLAVLHTWNQKIGLHPHLHCLVPAGGLSN